MKLEITKQADKVLSNDLDAKQYRQVGRKMLSLLHEPIPSDSSLLKGGSGERRVDVGEYRIIYEVAGDTVKVLVIGKRNGDEVYKLWKQMQ